MAHRFSWLASKTDTWVTSGRRDKTGQSGRYIGNQLELRLRWNPLPGNLQIETGGAYLLGGEFIKNTQPSDIAYRNTFYGYFQASWYF